MIALALSAALFAATATPSPSAPIKLTNGDFEAPAGANVVPGWTQIQHAGKPSYEIVVDTKAFHAGHASARITRTLPQHYGMIDQQLPARELAGKDIELSAWLKTEKVGPEGFVLVVNFAPSFNPDSQARAKPQVGTTKWTKVTLRTKVPPGTQTMNVGLMLLDSGSAWVDDVQLRTVAAK